MLSACGDPAPWSSATWRPERAPQRVVLASVLAAESLLDLLPRERISGVHAFAAEPAWSLVADRTEGLPLLGAEPEQLLSVRPDLVVVDAYTRAETLALLSSAGVPVVRTADPHGFDDIAHNLEHLGRVTHLEAEVAARIDALHDQLARIREAARGRPVWRLMSLDGALHTYGTDSAFDAVARAAGARNLAAEHGVGTFRKLDVEELLAWRPDALVIAGAPDSAVPAWIEQYPGLELLECVRRSRLLFVPTPLLGTTSHRLADTAAFVQRRLAEWGAP